MNAKNNLKQKSFSTWTQTEVEKQFSLTLQLHSPTLEEWLQAEESITDFEQQILEKVRKRASVYLRGWNEMELMAKLMIYIFDLVDFDQITYSLFLERLINGNVNDVGINGKIDMMIATGRDEPENAYFFLQQFKREKANSGDTIAQLLLTMLLAQQENDDNKPIYGSYINGRMWFFVVLEGNTYTLSDSYTATQQDDLHQIVRILKSLKKKIEHRLSVK